MAYKKSNPNGQATMAASDPVVIASNQTAIPVTGAVTTDLGKAEDTAHVSGDTGVMALGVRKDSATQLAGTDGDYSPLITDVTGRLHVNIGNVTPGTGTAQLGKAEDAVHTSGDTGVMMLGVRNDAVTSLVDTSGDYEPIHMDASGNVRVSINGAGLTPGTAANQLGKAEDVAHASGDTGVMMLSVRNDGAATAFSNTNGDYTPMGVDAAGTLSVHQKASTATLSNVASSATSVTLLAANTARKGAQIYNDSTQVLYVKFGATASVTSFTVPLAAATYYEVPAGYTGIIDGIWASANGNARVTEET